MNNIYYKTIKDFEKEILRICNRIDIENKKIINILIKKNNFYEIL